MRGGLRPPLINLFPLSFPMRGGYKGVRMVDSLYRYLWRGFINMKIDQIDNEERKIYTLFEDKTKPELKRYRCRLIIASVVVSLAGLGGMIWFCIMPTITCCDVLLIGGLFYSLCGAVILAVAAVSSKATIRLMCMTFTYGNIKLFAGFMKARFSAIVGICFLVGGFFIQASAMAMLMFGS
jgi:hypothetical protein